LRHDRARILVLNGIDTRDLEHDIEEVLKRVNEKAAFKINLNVM
jgi:hypothetical protein